ncbi:Sre1 cleavage activating protein Scp1 [Schizosaccharomyces cryophilus OY26]|uniref:Sterol regulatory element-binding protein cleavage-activating protein n=1 Tax=Schizosaccharomyces cryophilus (strain OY26 / ATCC MYA-4695 / CBS 11777 / NBRC 106824 / NRRL Y48691) TaxID=653667 RepID=S9X8R1_SCHCR|nr:Sre1 cleavage activating protein Scp1 [Schizosaccharomyces cryophilus OY26]EPY53552.1 Sre1 cleavage activating protein Scp1 [Schizosaccharomyces cryophilus OY26]
MKFTAFKSCRITKKSTRALFPTFIANYSYCIASNPWYFILIFTLLSITGIYSALVAYQQSLSDSSLTNWSAWFAECINAKPLVITKQLYLLGTNSSVYSEDYLSNAYRWETSFHESLAQNDYPCIRDEKSCVTISPIPKFYEKVNPIAKYSYTKSLPEEPRLLNNDTIAEGRDSLSAFVITYFLKPEHLDTFNSVLQSFISESPQLYASTIDQNPTTVVARIPDIIRIHRWYLWFGFGILLYGYLYLSLVRLQDVRAKFGLTSTIFIQSGTAYLSACSILYFFERTGPICPWPVAYYIIIFMDIENSFRLLRVVIASSPTKRVPSRIMEGFTATFLTSLTSLFTKLVTLFILSFFVYPLVQEFCLFLACSFVISFMLHMSFFLAVLSVDIRRLELQDFLDAPTSAINAKRWFTYLDYFKFLWSPYIINNLGVFSLYAFIIFLQLRSSMQINGFWRLASPNIRFLITLYHRLGRITRERKLFPLITTGWLADSSFLKDLARKTDNDELVFALYRPIIIDTIDRDNYTSIYNSFYDRRVWRWSTFFSVLFIIDFAVGILVKGLLRGWSDHDENTNDDSLHQEKFVIHPIPLHHQLDILRIAISSNHKTLASYGLDKCLVVWDLQTSQVKLKLNKQQMPKTLKTFAIDPSGNLIALFSKDILYILDVNAPCLLFQCFFQCQTKGRLNAFWLPEEYLSEEVKVYDLVVTEPSGDIQVFRVKINDGVAEILLEQKFSLNAVILKSIPILSPIANRFICLTVENKVIVYTKKGSEWTSSNINENNKVSSERIKDIFPISPADMLFIADESKIAMINLKDNCITHSFAIPNVADGTLTVGVSNSRFVKGQFRISSISFCFVHQTTRNVVYRHYGSADNESYMVLNEWGMGPNQVDLHDPDNSIMEESVENLQESIQEMQNVGSWVMSFDGMYVYGIRSRKNIEKPRAGQPVDLYANASLRNRKQKLSHHHDWTSYVPLLDSYLQEVRQKRSLRGNSGSQSWEVWMYSQAEKREQTRQLKMFNQLYIAEPGPSLVISQRSVAITLGNYITFVGYGSKNAREFYYDNVSNEMSMILEQKRKSLM